MSNGSPNREIPENIKPTINGLTAVAATELRNGNYKRAELFFRRELEIINQKEKELKASIHKGAAYYNLGLSLLLQNQTKEAFENFLIAYVEDVFNVPFGEEDNADTAPARKMLEKFQVKNEDLKPIKLKAVEEKKNIEKWKVIDPIPLAKRLVDNLFRKAIGVRLEKPSPDMFDAGKLPEKKVSVFIGGPFKIAAYLRELRRIFIEVRPHYVSYMSLDFVIEEERTHDSCMTILSNCGHAIFDVSTEAGQYAEIEHARIRGIPSILVYSAVEEEDKNHPPIPAMIRTVGFPTRGFRFMNELADIFREFLPEQPV
jgi:hypothetical protein